MSEQKMIPLEELGVTPELMGSWYDPISKAMLLPDMGKAASAIDRFRHLIEPKIPNIFRAFHKTPLENVKVLIIGQDPYPGGEADGLCFSASKMTPSLRVIFEALRRQKYPRTITTLDDWAEQGVLLLNTSLTTIRTVTFAHEGYWTPVIDAALTTLRDQEKPFLVMAWGKAAHTVADLYFERYPHVTVLKSCHPQFMNYKGGSHLGDFYIVEMFSRANEYLTRNNYLPVHWGDPIVNSGDVPSSSDIQGSDAGTVQPS